MKRSGFYEYDRKWHPPHVRLAAPCSGHLSALAHRKGSIKDAYHMLKRQGMCYLLSASKQREGWPRPGRTRGVSAVSGLPPFLLLKDNGKGLAGV